MKNSRNGKAKAKDTTMFNEDHRSICASETTSLPGTKGTKLGCRDNVFPLREQPPSLRLRTILSPVDFSERSLQALDIAVSLARQFGADIILLHVKGTMIPPSRYESANIRRLRREIWLDGKRRLAALASKRVKPLVAVRHHVAQGSPYAVIVDFAAKARADLIVMPSEGRTGLRRVLIGSVTERVVRHAGCPVLVVRPHIR